MAELLELGKDIELDPEAEELAVHYAHVGRLENLERMPKLKKLVFVATGLRRIENLHSCASQLVHLEIYQANLKSMENLETLTNLQVLDLAFNQISEIRNLEHLPNLEKLYLSANEITEIVNLERLAKLRVLELGSNQIREIRNLDHLAATLEELWLGKNRIRTLPVFSASVSFARVHTLSLQSNKLKEWSPGFLAAFPQLKKLYLSSNALADPDEETLRAMPACLEELDIACNKLTHIPDFSVKPLVHLKELWLNDNQISDLGELGRLGTLPNIETVYLERNPVQTQVPVEYVNTMRRVCPRLVQLDAVPLRAINVTATVDPDARSILKTD